MAGRTEYRGTRGIREAQRTVKRPRDAGQSRDLKKGRKPPDLAWRSPARRSTARKTRGPGPCGTAPRGKAQHGAGRHGKILRGAKLAQWRGAAWHIAARCRPHEETKGGRPESRDAHRTINVTIDRSEQGTEPTCGTKRCNTKRRNCVA